MSDEEKEITNRMPVAAEERLQAADEGECPFCFDRRVSQVTDCFDANHQKICELWYCQVCGGFFPRSVAITPAEKARRLQAEQKEREEKKEAEEDRRRAPRFPVQFVVQVDFGDDIEKGAGHGFGARRGGMSEPIVAMVMNAGMGGLCFRYPKHIEEGKEALMKISLPSAQRSFSAKGRVVRSTLLPDGSYGLGVQFVDVEPEYRVALKRYVSLD